MSEQRSHGMIGFLAGIAVGAAMGLLFAPASGKETRDRIKTRARKAHDDLDDLIAEGREKWGRAKGKATDAAKMTREDVDDLVRFVLEEGRDLWDRVTEEGREGSRKTER